MKKRRNVRYLNFRLNKKIYKNTIIYCCKTAQKFRRVLLCKKQVQMGWVQIYRLMMPHIMLMIWYMLPQIWDLIFHREKQHKTLQWDLMCQCQKKVL